MNKIQRFFLMKVLVLFASTHVVAELSENLQFKLLRWSHKTPPTVEIDGELYVIVNKGTNFSHMRKIDSEKTQPTPLEIIQFLDEKMDANMKRIAQEALQSEGEEGQRQSNKCCVII